MEQIDKNGEMDRKMDSHDIAMDQNGWEKNTNFRASDEEIDQAQNGQHIGR